MKRKSQIEVIEEHLKYFRDEFQVRKLKEKRHTSQNNEEHVIMEFINMQISSLTYQLNLDSVQCSTVMDEVQ